MLRQQRLEEAANNVSRQNIAGYQAQINNTQNDVDDFYVDEPVFDPPPAPPSPPDSPPPPPPGPGPGPDSTLHSPTYSGGLWRTPWSLPDSDRFQHVSHQVTNLSHTVTYWSPVDSTGLQQTPADSSGIHQTPVESRSKIIDTRGN